jgi:hypothetical protein
MMKGMFTSDEFSLFLLSLRPPRSSSFQLLVLVVIVVAGGGIDFVLLKTLNRLRGFMIVVGMLCRDLASAHHLWPAHPATYPRCSRFGQRLVQVYPPFFHLAKHDAIIVGFFRV